MTFDAETLGYDVSYFETSAVFWGLRILGAVLAPVMFFKLGPGWLHTPGTGGLMWGRSSTAWASSSQSEPSSSPSSSNSAASSSSVPLARPVMKPLFKVPGRAALDSLASWVGSYSVGLYVTRNVFERGGYHKRDVFTIATCFSTVSIGFVGVVAATLEMLSLFPVIFAAYFFCVVVTATILVRVPPISRVSEEYIEEPDPELAFSGSPSDYFRLAVSEGCRKGKGRRNVPAGRNSRVRRRTETDESHPGHYSRGRPGCDAAVGQHAGVPDTRRTTDPDNLRPGHPQR